MLSPRHEPARPEVRYPVLQLPKLELCFACGSCLWLKQINNDPLVRLIEHDGKKTAIDLRDLCPSLEADYIAATVGDRPAVIFFTLRQQFKTVGKFLEAVEAMPITSRRRHAAVPPDAPRHNIIFTSGLWNPFSEAGDRRFFAVDTEASA